LDLVIAGHAHAYEHLIRDIGGRILHVLITGGAGGSLEVPTRTVTGASERVVLAHHYSTLRADTQSLVVRVEDANGLVLDAWHLGR
jgi:hypothetical protein